jgi:hypothetical protein
MPSHIVSRLCWILLLVGSTAAIADDLPKSKVAVNDAMHLAFGKIVETSVREKPDWKDPHRATAYAVGMCRDGKTKDLIKEMGHVQEDAELASISTVRTSLTEINGC